jgi:hypothetical protein
VIDRVVRTAAERNKIILGSRRIDVRLRVIALVLLVIAATAAGFVLTRVDSWRDAWLVSGTGLALAAVTSVLLHRQAAVRHQRRDFARP